MADGIIDPAVIQSSQSVEQASFLNKVAPVVTGIAGTALLGPVGGIGLGLLQRASTQLDLRQAEQREAAAIADYARRGEITAGIYNSTREQIKAFSQIPGISDEQVQQIALEAESYFQEAQSLNPEIALSARSNLQALSQQMRSAAGTIDMDIVTEQRDMLRSNLEDARSRFVANDEGVALGTSAIDEALELVENHDPNDPAIRGRILSLLGSTVDQSTTAADAWAQVPIIGGLISGKLKADDINMDPIEWRDMLLSARNSIVGTGDLIREGLIRETEQLEPFASQLNIMPEGFSGVDYVTGSALEFNDAAPTTRKAALQSLSPLESFAGSMAPRATGGSLDVLRNSIADTIGGWRDDAVVHSLYNRLPPGAQIAFDDQDQALVDLPDGTVRAIQLSPAERAALENKRRRAAREAKQ